MRWLRRLFIDCLDPILRNQFQIEEYLLRIENKVTTIEERVNFANDRLFAAKNEIEREQPKDEPLAVSRPSWMRMKKNFEERDVRSVLAAQHQADAVEEYWKQKNSSTGRI